MVLSVSTVLLDLNQTDGIISIQLTHLLTKAIRESVVNASNDGALNRLVRTIQKHVLKRGSSTMANFISVINLMAEKKGIQLNGPTEQKVRVFLQSVFPVSLLETLGMRSVCGAWFVMHQLSNLRTRLSRPIMMQ
jgi:hypothetical protein